MVSTGYLGSVGAPAWLDHDVDVWFVADLARGMQWDARFDETIRADARTRALHQQIAAGTADALLWVLGPVLVSPATGRRNVDRSRAGLARELEAAVMRRAVASDGSADWYYLGGVADALEFALGMRRAYWWVPLPESLRAGPPARDEYAFSV